MATITNIIIADQKAKRTVGNALTGEYLSAPGNASQVIAVDVRMINGGLVLQKLYTIAADIGNLGMNYQYDHSQRTNDGNTLYVFYQTNE